MGKDKANKNKASKAAVVADETPDESTGKGSPIERIARRGHDSKTLQPNWKAFSEYVVENGGPRIKPEHIGVVLTGYKFYQKSDAAKAAREEVSTTVAQTREQKAAAKAERAKQAEARRAEQAEAKAGKEKTASKAGKTAAAASKPAKKVAASSAATKAAPAAKKAAAKKTAAPKGKAGKGKGAKAPY